jgi:hypothetical protein
MSSRYSASYNPTLTNYAVGLAADITKQESRLAEFLAPEVPVPAGIGQYKVYSDRNSFTAYDTARPLGNRPNRVSFGATDAAYNCKPQGLEIPVDDAEIEAAGNLDGAADRLNQAKIRTLVVSAHLSHEKHVVDTILAGVAAQSGFGKWADTQVDPIDEIDEQIEAIAIATGQMPNKIALDIAMWRKLRSNKNVKARFGSAGGREPSLQDFAGVLLNPAITVRVGLLSYATNKAGQSSVTKSTAMTNSCLILANSDMPTEFDPSAAKTFTTREGGVEAVLTLRDDLAHSDVHQVLWSRDVVISASSAIRRIDLTS